MSGETFSFNWQWSHFHTWTLNRSPDTPLRHHIHHLLLLLRTSDLINRIIDLQKRNHLPTMATILLSVISKSLSFSCCDQIRLISHACLSLLHSFSPFHLEPRAGRWIANIYGLAWREWRYSQLVSALIKWSRSKAIAWTMKVFRTTGKVEDRMAFLLW